MKRRGFLTSIAALIATPVVAKFAPAPVINWAKRLAAKEVAWQSTIVLNCRGRANPFLGLVGGTVGAKPITEVMDFSACRDRIKIELDR